MNEVEERPRGKVYKTNGMAHRANGPAYDNTVDNMWVWWYHGTLHRYYGPSHSIGEWWLYNRYVK